MIYMLDTDSIIFIIRSAKKGQPSAVRRKGRKLIDKIKEASGRKVAVGISAVTKAELEYGAERSVDPVRERAALKKILAPFDEFDFDVGKCARYYGKVRGDLERRGLVIGGMDLLIAAHAMALEATLISNNTRHFRRIEGLKLENWTV